MINRRKIYRVMPELRNKGYDADELKRRYKRADPLRRRGYTKDEIEIIHNLEDDGYDGYDAEEIVDIMNDRDCSLDEAIEIFNGDDEDFIIRVKKPKKATSKNDVATMMKFVNEVIKNIELAEDESAITLDFSDVNDFTNAKITEVIIPNKNHNKDKE